MYIENKAHVQFSVRLCCRIRCKGAGDAGVAVDQLDEAVAKGGRGRRRLQRQRRTRARGLRADPSRQSAAAAQCPASRAPTTPALRHSTEAIRTSGCRRTFSRALVVVKKTAMAAWGAISRQTRCNHGSLTCHTLSNQQKGIFATEAYKHKHKHKHMPPTQIGPRPQMCHVTLLGLHESGRAQAGIGAFSWADCAH